MTNIGATATERLSSRNTASDTPVPLSPHPVRPILYHGTKCPQTSWFPWAKRKEHRRKKEERWFISLLIIYSVKSLEALEEQIVEQYPCSDRELNGTNVIGTEYDALFIQLENEVENARRPSTICSQKRPTKREDGMSKKSRNSDHYGCVQSGSLLLRVDQNYTLSKMN